MLFKKRDYVNLFGMETTRGEFPEVMTKVGRMMEEMSKQNITVDVKVFNNPGWCVSGDKIDINCFGSELAKVYFDTHREMFGL